MKKVLILLAGLSLLATTSFAEVYTSAATIESDDTTPVLIAKLSNNVNGQVLSGQTRFAAVMKHLNGTRNFATSSTDPKIYWEAVVDANKGTTTLEVTLANSDTSDFSDWTAL
jgi:hypothetical protein